MNPGQLLRKIVNAAKGDDLERAQSAFKNMTAAAMQEQYGQSGRSPAEILDGYLKHRAEWEDASRLLDGMLLSQIKL